MVKKLDTKHVTLNMPVAILERIEELAEKNHRDRSKEIIFACQEYIDRHYSPSGDHPQLSPDERLQDLQRTAREYVMDNPEILMDIYQELKGERSKSGKK
ncbi:hypothetical protein [Methanolacinia paynteri]|uniref:hypothetical protein n=1 Tax=Methanolacinia paynteri TaxID=230356 RepID=UPI00064F3BA8|nr:hypothetical protein [Methanolacinia paynteri]